MTVRRRRNDVYDDMMRLRREAGKYYRVGETERTHEEVIVDPIWWAIERWPDRVEVRPLRMPYSATGRDKWGRVLKAPFGYSTPRMRLGKFKTPSYQGPGSPALMPKNAKFKSQRSAIIVAKRVAKSHGLTLIMVQDYPSMTWRPVQ